MWKYIDIFLRLQHSDSRHLCEHRERKKWRTLEKRKGFFFFFPQAFKKFTQQEKQSEEIKCEASRVSQWRIKNEEK